jgi:transposase
MIVIGADPHKLTHTAAAIDGASGELRSSETVAARDSGHAALLDWARALDWERVWAIEDCRHVSGGLERPRRSRRTRRARPAEADGWRSPLRS